MVAAEVDELHAGFLQLADQRVEVLVAGVQAFEDGNLDAGVFHGLLHLGGDAFAVLLLVVQYRDGLVLVAFGDELAGHRALHVVQADRAEDQLVAARGDFRGGGRRVIISTPSSS